MPGTAQVWTRHEITEPSEICHGGQARDEQSTQSGQTSQDRGTGKRAQKNDAHRGRRSDDLIIPHTPLHSSSQDRDQLSEHDQLSEFQRITAKMTHKDDKNALNNSAESTPQPLTPYIPTDPIKFNNLKPAPKAILQAKLDNPDATIAEIGKSFVDKGIHKHPKSIYRALKKNDYLRREIKAIESHHYERLQRKIVPQALDLVEKAMRSKDLDIKDKVPFIKLGLDKGMADRSDAPAQVLINIQTAEAVQINNRDVLDDIVSGR